MEGYRDHPVWDYIDPLPMNGLYRVYKDGKWGCADEYGTLVIPFRWQFIGHGLADHLFVKEQGLWGLLRRDGTLTEECRWNSMIRDPKDPHTLILTRTGETRRLRIASL